MKQWMVLTVLISVSCGCTTYQPISGRPSDLSARFGDGGELKAGDHLVIRTIQGRKLKLVVRSVQDEVIVGNHDRVRFADIARLEKRQFSPAKTTVLAVVLLGVVGAIAYAASHAAPTILVGGAP
jgi:hypothetical protein